MKRLFLYLLVVAAFPLTLLVPVSSQPAVALSDFTVRFIDVGQGDVAWLKTPDGLDILIDGGRYGDAYEYLQDKGSPDIETMVASHPDADHIGGLVPILENLPVYEVIRDGQTHTTQTFQNFIDLIALKGIPDHLARWPDSYTWGCCVTAQVLNPVEPFAFSDRNENSVVLRVSYGQVDFLFTGDAGSPAESAILARTNALQSEILKVPHHGSASASSAQFLSAVQPETAVISVGPNPYGHPDPTVVARLDGIGASIYQTDEQGTVSVTSNGSSHSVSTTLSATQTAYLPLIMKNHPLPDLIPLYMKIELETGGSCDYSSPTVLGLRVWFKNVGEADTGLFVIEVNGSPWAVSSGLAAGKTASLWRGGYKWGENTVFVDATDAVRESNEDNNVLTQMVPIPTLPPTCTPTISPTPFVTATPSSTPSSTRVSTPTPTGTPTPSKTAAQTSTPTLTPTPTPTPTYTATPSFTATSTSTPSPTLTATSPPAVADVQVNGFCSQFDAPGNDHQNLNQEWVCFSNYGGDADVTGWRVRDEANHTYVFPSFTLPAGETVRLHTGSGPDGQTDLYWGSGRAIWNNSGDTVYLYNARGSLVDRYGY